LARDALWQGTIDGTLTEDERDLADFDDLSAVERWQILFVRSTFASPSENRIIRILQRRFSANWIHVSTRNLVHVRGAERLPQFTADTTSILGGLAICPPDERSSGEEYARGSLIVSLQLGHHDQL
jgi:hypothetical protein